MKNTKVEVRRRCARLRMRYSFGPVLSSGFGAVNASCTFYQLLFSSPSSFFLASYTERLTCAVATKVFLTLLWSAQSTDYVVLLFSRLHRFIWCRRQCVHVCVFFPVVQLLLWLLRGGSLYQHQTNVNSFVFSVVFFFC